MADQPSPKDAAAAPWASVTVVMPDGQRSEHQLNPGETVVGRGRASGLVIAEETVSRSHLKLLLDGQGLLAEDLGSHNGTLVNGVKIGRQWLAHGDRLKLGNCHLEVALAQPAAATPPPYPAAATPPLPQEPPAAAYQEAPAASPPEGDYPVSPGDLAHLHPPGGLRRLWRRGVGFLVAGLALIIVGMAAALLLASSSPDLLAVGAMGAFILVPLYLLAEVCLGTFLVCWFVLCFKSWQLIQFSPGGAPTARVRPGQAVGFLLIPLFNIYWVYQAFLGLAQDMNRFARLHGIPGREVGERLALATCVVFSVCYGLGLLAAVASWAGWLEATGLFSGLSLLCGLVYLVMFFMLWSRLVGLGSAILRAKHGLAPEAEQAPSPKAQASQAGPAASGQGGQVEWGQASQVRRFDASQGEVFDNHLKYLRALIGEGFFPLLRVYALQARAAETFPQLILITGEAAEYQRLGDRIFLAREEEVLRTLYDGRPELVRPHSTLSGGAEAGGDLGQALALIQEGRYQVAGLYFSPQQADRLNQAQGRAPAAPPPLPPGPAAPSAPPALPEEANGQATEIKPARMDFDAVMAHLKGGDVAACLAAIRAAREQKMTQGGIVYELINLLGHADGRVRSEAALTLVRLEMVGFALRSLKDEYQFPAHMGKDQALQAVKLLEQTLNDPAQWAALHQENWEKY